MDSKNLKELLRKYKEGNCSADEKELLESWVTNGLLTEGHLSESEIDQELNSISRKLPLVQRQRSLWPRIAAAASIILCLAISGYFLLNKQQQLQHIAQSPVHDIAPGGNKAILTLANGKKIILNDAANGKLAVQSGIKVIKAANGQITYTIANTKTVNTNVAFNTIETPVGGQYQVILPDGTKVWLNAASVFRYPVMFTGKERKVELTGEAYFEVAHNKNMPFRVVNPRQTIEVLGTHFNIMAYDDEMSVKTTLLEGSVKVSDANHSIVLNPGQQSQVKGPSIEVINDANISDVVAWRNGRIQFSNSNIESIMRMLSRWYNIDVRYTGSKISTSFGGSVSRSKNLSVILKVLESTGDVHFKIEGRRVTVMP